MLSRYDWHSPVPPPGYIAGAGRGAKGFITNAELHVHAAASGKGGRTTQADVLLAAQNKAIEEAMSGGGGGGVKLPNGIGTDQTKKTSSSLYGDLLPGFQGMSNADAGTLFGAPGGAPQVATGGRGANAPSFGFTKPPTPTAAGTTAGTSAPSSSSRGGGGAAKLSLLQQALAGMGAKTQGLVASHDKKTETPQDEDTNRKEEELKAKPTTTGEDDDQPASSIIVTAKRDTTGEGQSRSLRSSDNFTAAAVTEEVLIILEERIEDHPEDPLNWVRFSRAHGAKDYTKKAIDILRRGATASKAGKVSEVIWIELLRQMEAARYPVEKRRETAELAIEYYTKSEELWQRAAEGQVLEDRQAELYWQGVEALPHSEALWLQVLKITPNEEEEGGGAGVHKEIIQAALEACPMGMPNLWLKYAEMAATAQEGVDILRSAVRSNPHSLLLWKQFAFFMERHPKQEEPTGPRDNNEVTQRKLVTELVVIVKAAAGKMTGQNSDGTKPKKITPGVDDQQPMEALPPRVSPPMSSQEACDCWLSELPALVQTSEALTKAILVHFFASSSSYSSATNHGEPVLERDAQRQPSLSWRDQMVTQTTQHFDRSLAQHAKLMKVLFEVAYLDSPPSSNINKTSATKEEGDVAVPTAAELHEALKAWKTVSGIQGVTDLFNTMRDHGVFSVSGGSPLASSPTVLPNPLTPPEEQKSSSSKTPAHQSLSISLAAGEGLRLAVQAVGFLGKVEAAESRGGLTAKAVYSLLQLPAFSLKNRGRMLNENHHGEARESVPTVPVSSLQGRVVLWYLLSYFSYHLEDTCAAPLGHLREALDEANIHLAKYFKITKHGETEGEEGDSVPESQTYFSPPQYYALLVDLYLRLSWANVRNGRTDEGSCGGVYAEAVQAAQLFPKSLSIWTLVLEMGAEERMRRKATEPATSAGEDDPKDLYFTALQENPDSDGLWSAAARVQLHRFGDGHTAGSILQEGLHLHPASPLLWRTRVEAEWHLHTGSAALSAASEGLRRSTTKAIAPTTTFDGSSSGSGSASTLLAATVDFEPPLSRPKKARTLMKVEGGSSGKYLNSAKVPVILSVARVYLLGGHLDRAAEEANKALLVSQNTSGDAFAILFLQALLLDMGAPLNQQEEAQKNKNNSGFDLRTALRQIPGSALSSPGTKTQQLLEKVLSTMSAVDFTPLRSCEGAAAGVSSHWQLARLVDPTGSASLSGYYWGLVVHGATIVPPSSTYFTDGGSNGSRSGKFADLCLGAQASLGGELQGISVTRPLLLGMPSSSPRERLRWWMYTLLEVGRLMMSEVGVMVSVKQ